MIIARIQTVKPRRIAFIEIPEKERPIWENDICGGLHKIRRMVSSGLLRRVALVRTDVSEELGTTLALTSNRRSVHSHRRENLKSYQIGCVQKPQKKKNDGSGKTT
jgi:hypothetical protein